MEVDRLISLTSSGAPADEVRLPVESVYEEFLRNVAEQMSVFGTDPITVDQLPTAILSDDEEDAEVIGLLRLAPQARVLPLLAFRSQCEREYIEMVLQRTNWNVSRAAELLDIQRTHLHQKIATLGIRRPEKPRV